MPTVYEAKIDGSNAVRYFHFSLIRFYLDQAYEHAIKSKEDDKEGRLLASSVIAIMFSAMALEAFANEISEDLIPKEELNDFVRLRKAYKQIEQESSLAAKLRILFERRHNHSLGETQLNDIENLVSLRNNLVHYKLSELAGRYIMPPAKQTNLGNGQFMTTLDFTLMPVRIEPPFIQQVSGDAAVNCFNIALLIINAWGNLSGELDNVPGLEVIA
ncbi:hypothetical protein [Methylotenera sp.]|uniref:hypothetical protein n=1 Tax=Methylotenera sp. TaxID=2051956 RepID=UPI002726999D|nr:hypothetical protein [Methylotenera sp.]MDO9204119.1 hypothetical protein [Methylotenera sp.]MDP2071721.1 hypothetical protein [Methylotenera sp.]MDP3006072.1 hypothetical protein [Methylotenera sp.]